MKNISFIFLFATAVLTGQCGAAETQMTDGASAVPPHSMMSHMLILTLSGIVIFLLLFALFGYFYFRRKEMLRGMNLLFSFPGRVGVCDENEQILFFHDKGDPASHTKKIKLKELNEVPDIAYQKISEAVHSVFTTGKPQILEYEHNNVMRAIMIAPLSELLFGKRCIVWYSYENIELQQARRNAEEIAERLHLTLKSIGDAVLVTDRNGGITLLNPVAEKLTGFRLEEVIGKPHEEVFRIVSYIDNTPVKSPLLTALTSGEIVQLANHTDLIAKDGSRRHIADSAAPIRTRNGEITGGILIFRDVTDEYDKRDKLRNALTRLEIGSELTNSASFRMNIKTREIECDKIFFDLWPVRQGKAAIREEVVYPPDLPEYARRSMGIYHGITHEDVWNYRALINGELRHFRMRARVDRSQPDGSYLLGVIQDVTDITRNLVKLKESTELWELAVNTMPIITFVKNISNNFRYAIANKAFSEFIGRPVSEIVGSTDFDLFQNQEDAELFREKDQEIISGGIGQEFIEKPRDAKGTVRHMRTTKIPFRNSEGEDMLLGIGVDLTELNAFSSNEKVINFCLETFFKTENANDAINQILETICLHMNASRAYILHFDMDTKLTDCLAEYATPGQNKLLTGYRAVPFSTEEYWMRLFQRRGYLFLPNLNHPEALAQLGSWGDFAQKANIQSLYATGLFVNGTLWGDLGLLYEEAPMPMEQFNLNFLQTVQHLLEMLLERKQAQEKILDALHAARAADRAKSYFIATVSHEIRTPLNAVIGLSELLRDSSLDIQTQRDYLDSIACSGNALLQLINDVLDLSKLEAGQMNIDPQPTSCSDLCQEIISIFRYSAERKGLALQCSLPPMPDLCIDKLRIRQILFNLLGNAVKFTQKGSIEIHAEFQQKDDHCGTFRFHVRDTGCGIAPEEQHNLFDPFVQAGTIRGTYASGNGTGLGLAIAKRLLECMNGRISVESTQGHGSCFTVEIQDVEFKKPSGIQTERENTANRYQGLRILIVDDVPLNVKVLHAMLRNIGCEVFCSGSAAEALDFLSGNTVDWVLTDLWMPDMNGAELASAIRQRYSDKMKNLKIVAVSADIESRSNFDMSGIDEVLAKPVSIEKLKKLLDS